MHRSLPPEIDQDLISRTTVNSQWQLRYIRATFEANHRIKQSSEDIVRMLARRGCLDLTIAIDPNACSSSPVAGGGFCDVYKGATRGGTAIAIKCLRVYDVPGKANEKQIILKCAAKELYHWSRLKHRNVLPLMGLAMFHGWISMVSPWIENGCVLGYLNENPDANRIDLCKGVCAGMSHIHANEMVHGDLKAANVMVSRDGSAMIADFGNSQLRDLTLKFTNNTNSSLSVRWAAPEILNKRGGPHASKKADIYAYGMTVLEILTGKPPYDGLSERRVLVLVAVKHKTPTRPATGVSDEIWGLLQSCWTWDENRRPDITIIEDRLQGLSLSASPQAAGKDFGAGRSEASTINLASLLSEIDSITISNDEANPTNFDKLWNVANLAATYYNQGRLLEAESLAVRVLAAQKRILGDHHPVTLRSMANLGATYYNQGRLTKAESLAVEVLAIQKRVLGNHHPDTLHSMASLAATYDKQGRLAEAESLAVEALAIQKRVLGNHHPITLRNRANLEEMYDKQGRITETESLAVEVLAMQKRVLGDHDPTTLRSMATLGEAHYNQGRLVEAEGLAAEVLAIQKRVLGDHDPITLRSMANLGATYYNQGRLVEAEWLATEVLCNQKRTLGVDHSDTLRSMLNLALTYSSQGRLTEAESLSTEVLTIRRRVLGDHHPEMLQSLANLAAIYNKQNRLAEAESLGVEALAIQKRVLGDHHPDTVLSLVNLAETYYRQGRLEEAGSLKLRGLAHQW